MRRELLNLFPDWALFILFTTIIILFALLVYKVSRRYFPKYLIRGGLHTSNIFLDIITISTILLAFTIVVLWQFFTATKDAVNSEAAALSQIIIYSKALPPEEQQNVNKAVGKYINVVVNNEWPLMREGKYSLIAESALDGIYISIENFTPASENQHIFFQQMLNSYNEVVHDRTKRLEAVETVIPDSFFFVIVTNLFMLVAAICLIEEKDKKPELLFILFVSTLIGINLTLILIMDYPFSGEFSINSVPFTQGVLEPIFNVSSTG